MSHIECPLCGLFPSKNKFTSKVFANDIYALSFKGLGRARGFAPTEKHSILDDTGLMNEITRRCHLILNLIEGGDQDEEEGLQELRYELDEYEEEFDTCLTLINESLPDEYEEFSDLENAIKSLVTEYQEALEELED
jgi:hypothetical protein